MFKLRFFFIFIKYFKLVNDDYYYYVVIPDVYCLVVFQYETTFMCT